MTKLLETNYIITLSKIVKTRDGDTTSRPDLDPELIGQLEEIIGQLIDDSSVVAEITKAPTIE